MNYRQRQMDNESNPQSLPEEELKPTPKKPKAKKKKKPKSKLKVKPRLSREELKRQRAEARSVPWKNNWAGKTDEQKLAWLTKIRESTKANGNKAGRPPGLPSGWTKDQWEFHCFSVKWTSKRYVEEIIKENDLDRNNPDDKYAIEAIEMAVNMMRQELPVKDRLAATKLVLEFTKAKPSTKSEVTLNSAEDFLAQVLKDEKG